MLKRLMDITGALFGLIVFFPILLVVTIGVRLKMGSPILFKQQRPGLHGKPFFMYKFRTMTNAKDENGHLLPDEKRLTKFGHFLRKTSIDELPELLNVLKGEMSLVGPRPLLIQYLLLYTQEQAKRHGVKPGVTGWAQINGRNAISWEQKFEYDVWYVDHQSLWLDIKIIVLTLWKVMRRDGISAEDHVTMPFFEGQHNHQ
ncbi:MAG: sugar transferase [Planctomycetaceae bacterium]|jgi:sugar transferase EpsL|nr:sugar transferase [Planctomycetaceae bacterium]